MAHDFFKSISSDNYCVKVKLCTASPSVSVLSLSSHRVCLFLPSFSALWKIPLLQMLIWQFWKVLKHAVCSSPHLTWNINEVFPLQVTGGLSGVNKALVYFMVLRICLDSAETCADTFISFPLDLVLVKITIKQYSNISVDKSADGGQEQNHYLPTRNNCKTSIQRIKVVERN